MKTIAEARAALQAAIDAQSPKAIKAARAALLAAEAGSAEERKPTPFEKKAKKVAAKKAEESEHEEPDGDEEPEAAAEPMEKEDDANPADSGEAVAEGEDCEAEDSAEEGDAEDGEAEYAEGEAEDGEAEAEEGEAEAEEMKKAKKMADGKKMKKAAAKGGSIGRLLAALGVSSVAEAAGKAQALVEAAAALEGEKRKAKRAAKAAAMASAFDAARRDGRVTKAEVEHLRTAYASRPVAELRAYLAAKPRIASSQFASESNAHYPSEAIAGVNLASPFATKAMQAFGVNADAIAERAAARGIATSFPGAAKR